MTLHSGSGNRDSLKGDGTSARVGEPWGRGSRLVDLWTEGDGHLQFHPGCHRNRLGGFPAPFVSGREGVFSSQKHSTAALFGAEHADFGHFPQGRARNREQVFGADRYGLQLKNLRVRCVLDEGGLEQGRVFQVDGVDKVLKLAAFEVQHKLFFANFEPVFPWSQHLIEGNAC